MAIAFVNIGTKGLGTTTCSCGHPASTAADQILVAGLAAWEPVLSFTAEAGWTKQAEDVSVGTGTATNAHLTGICAHTKELTGADAGPTVFDLAGAGLTGSIGAICSYSKGASNNWAIATTTGDDATHAANRSMAGVGSIDFAPGDMLVGCVSVDTDSALTISAPAFTASGITFGTTTRRTSGAGNGAGDNGNIEIFDALVSSGSGTVAPTLAFTTATSQCGGVVFVRLREVSAGPPASLIIPKYASRNAMLIR